MCTGKSELGSAGQNLAGLGWTHSYIRSLWQLEKRLDYKCWLAAEGQQGDWATCLSLSSWLAWAFSSSGDGRDSKISQRGPAPMCKHFLSLCCVTFTVVTLVKANHMAKSRPKWVWNYPRAYTEGRDEYRKVWTNSGLLWQQSAC